MTVHNVYAQLMRYLFRPKPSTLDFIHAYSSFFALPSIFSVGIHIRTGDASMNSTESDKVNVRLDPSSAFEEPSNQSLLPSDGFKLQVLLRLRRCSRRSDPFRAAGPLDS